MAFNDFWNSIFPEEGLRDAQTEYARRNLLRRQEEEDAAYAAKKNLLSGQYDAKPAAYPQLDPSWPADVPEDVKAKRNLLNTINPEAAIARAGARLNPAPPVFQKFSQGEGGGMVDPQTGTYTETVKPGYAPPKIPDILVPGVLEAEISKSVAAAQAGRAPRETWRRMTPEEAAAANLPRGGSYEVSSDGQTRAVVQPTREMGPGQLKLAQAEVGANSINFALDKFEQAIKETPENERLGAMFGGLTESGQRLNTAWTNAALLAKGEDLYNLGVLSGPDLEIIQKALPDPSTKTGTLKNKSAYYSGIKQVRELLNNKLSAQRRALGGSNQPATSEPANNYKQKYGLE